MSLDKAASVENRSWRPLRLSVVATLILLTLQGWTGDFLNVFVTTSQQSVEKSISGFFKAVLGLNPFLTWHGIEGFLILLSAIGVFVVSLRYHRRSVKIAALLGLIFVVVAGLGGYLFVLSGFTDGGNTMQMGASFSEPTPFTSLPSGTQSEAGTTMTCDGHPEGNGYDSGQCV